MAGETQITLVGNLVDGLDLQSRGDQLRGEIAGRYVSRQVDILPKPGNRDAHQISIPKAEVKRTSPSTMSCMSWTPWANISVRSTPRPNAQPL